MSRATVIRCDGCDKEVELPLGVTWPPGWRRVTVSFHDRQGRTQSHKFDICEPMCAARVVDLTYDDLRLATVIPIGESPQAGR